MTTIQLNNEPTVQTSIASPCIRNCCLDNNDVCLGCYRHLEEIKAWSQASAQQKSTILSAVAQRKSQSQSQSQVR